MEKEFEGFYTCPMHPEVKRDGPGICPDCGMNLVPLKKSPEHPPDNREYDKHAGHKTNVFKIKFLVSLALTIPVLFYAEVLQEIFNYKAPDFYGSDYVPLIFASIIFFYGGWIFIVSAYRELKAKLPGMMTLISIAISTAYIYSVYITFIGGDETLFWELSTLITVMLLGHWMEMRAVSAASGALKELSKLLPDKAELIQGGSTIMIFLRELKEGDLVLVKPGGRIPADGIVFEGSSDVNESIITGESKPVAKKEGDEVIAGSTNGDGSLKVRVNKIGEKTFLSGVMRLVVEAEASKSKLQILSDRAAYYLTIIAVITGVATFAFWILLSDFSFAIERMVAVLVIACPHALGLAIPLVASISTTKAARSGFLVKRRLALESARNINTILFDKTGTLTKGEFGVSDILFTEGYSDKTVLKYSASINNNSEHPIAVAVVKSAKEKGLEFFNVSKFKRIPGKGVEAEIDGLAILVGSDRLLEERGLYLDESLKIRIDELTKQGKTINFVILGGKVIGAIALTDVIRDESREAIKTLKDMGIKPVMITGDADDVAKWVAGELGIDEYFSRVLPEQKSEKVKLLQSRGLRVAMVGDGVNDAPALTQADLGIAVGAGTNVAIESAGIILIKNDPRDIVKIIKLSRLTYIKMIQNLLWATGYNVVAIPLAAGILISWGILLQPALAAFFMSASTVIVAVNATMLRNKSL
ncbi:MAG TPA: heavy metal translocating P-type ATPase [Candidatus Paceibacterota bacterium]